MTVDVQVAAIDGDPVLCDISYIVQFLKAKFITPINCRSLIRQNGNYQKAYFRRSQDHLCTSQIEA